MLDYLSLSEPRCQAPGVIGQCITVMLHLKDAMKESSFEYLTMMHHFKWFQTIKTENSLVVLLSKIWKVMPQPVLHV